MKRLIINAVGIFLLFGIIACEKENEDHQFEYDVGGTHISICEINNQPFFKIQGVVDTDLEMNSSKKWLLDGGVVVVDGGKLIIQAGTQVFGNVSFHPSFLSIEEGGTLVINGEDDNPVEFNSINDFYGDPSEVDWGGVFVNGIKLKGFNTWSNTEGSLDASENFFLNYHIANDGKPVTIR